MKKIYAAFICFFLLNCVLFATQTPGFIITKDAKIIPGKVASIFYSNWKTELIFINEMGRRYYFHPAVIHGFALQKKGKTLKFESKFLNGRWQFLQVLETGKGLNLYQSPSLKTEENLRIYAGEKMTSRNVKELWIAKKAEAPRRVYLISYKKTLRNHLANQPELLKKIGKKGYRFRHLRRIIQEYNDLMEEQTKRI